MTTTNTRRFRNRLLLLHRHATERMRRNTRKGKLQRESAEETAADPLELPTTKHHVTWEKNSSDTKWSNNNEIENKRENDQQRKKKKTKADLTMCLGETPSRNREEGETNDTSRE